MKIVNATDLGGLWTLEYSRNKLPLRTRLWNLNLKLFQLKLVF